MKYKTGLIWLVGLTMLALVWPRLAANAQGSDPTPNRTIVVQSEERFPAAMPLPRPIASPEDGLSADAETKSPDTERYRVRLGIGTRPQYDRYANGAWERIEPTLLSSGENTNTEYVSEHGQIQVHLPARLGAGAIRVSRTAYTSRAMTPATLLTNNAQKCGSVPQSTTEDFSNTCKMTDSQPKSPAPDAVLAGQASLAISGDVTWTPLRLTLVDAAGHEEIIGKVAQVQGVAQGNVITYANTFRGIVERFAAHADGLKHDVILLSPDVLSSAASMDKVLLSYQGMATLSPNLTFYANGARQAGDFTTTAAIELQDAAGNSILYMPPVMAYEQANPLNSVRGQYSVHRTPDGMVLSFGVRHDWLTSPQRKYPVIIDPAVFIWPPAADALIWRDSPASNYGSFPELWVGDPYRSLIQWDLSPLPNRAMIDYSVAHAELTTNFGPAMLVSTHGLTNSWTEGGVTWNSRNGADNWITPGGDFSSAENTVSVGTVTNTLSSWVLTDLVAEWPSGTSDFGFRANYGILLQPETYPAPATKIFGSKEGSGFKPQLDIFYTQGPVTLSPYVPGTRGVPSPDWYTFQGASLWNALAIRPPAGADYDLNLSSTAAYIDILAISAFGGNQVDYVVVDSNHAPVQSYYPQVYQFSGRGTYPVEHATSTADLVGPGTYGPYTTTPANVVRVWDMNLIGGTTYHIAVKPIAGDANLSIALHKSQQANSASWYQGRGSSVAFADNAAGGLAEFFSYTAPQIDRYGFVVVNNGATTDSSYMIYVDTTAPSGSFNINNGSAYANSIIATLNISATDSETSVRDMRFRNSPSLLLRALVLQDSLPWGTASIQQILAANNIPYDQLDSSAIPAVDLGLYSMVIVPSVQGDAFCNIYNSNLSRFENYVQGGGVLELHGATQSSDSCRPRLPGGGVNNQDLQEYNTVVSPTHPVMAGVPSPFFGSYASHNSFTGYPANTFILATAGNVPGGNATLIEYAFGSGKVLASGQTLEYGWANGQSAGTILANAIPYAAGLMPFSTATTWVLPPSDGVKTVYGQFRNHAGMWSPVYTDTIVLDTQAPASSAASPDTDDAGPIAVIWVASDALSGVSSTALWVKFGGGGTWTNTGLSQTGTSGTFNYTPTNGNGTYYFATVATDHAGNVEATPTGSGDDSTVYSATYSVYLPRLLRNDCTSDDSLICAFGPLSSGQTYQRYPDDTNDYFYIDLPTTGRISATVSNFQATGDLVLRDSLNRPLNNWGRGGTTMSVSASNLSPGRYYLQVYVASGFNNSSPYTLIATFP